MPLISAPRPFNDGGVSTPGWFNVGVLFQTFEAALAGEREFRDHGHVVEFLDEIDDYSNATFLTVSRLILKPSLILLPVWIERSGEAKP
jgi:hypothetical protein